MPIINQDDFTPPLLLRSGHYNTIVPSIIYPSPIINYERQRWTTPDDDFLDIDFVQAGKRSVILLLHGLEGSSASVYNLHFADFFNRRGFDIVAMNYRGCSGEMNRHFEMYNSGTTQDVDFVVQKLAIDYDQIAVIGFSLGGNLLLKYLGEGKYTIPENLKCGVAISTPVDLSGAAQQLLKPYNILYQKKFIRTLRQKLKAKNKQFPGRVNMARLSKIKNLYQFDDQFTAPIFGYKNAEDYYQHNTSNQFFSTIERPALLINAVNDPFLSETCYPRAQAHDNARLYYLETKYGGHVGFAYNRKDRSWAPTKAYQFIREYVDLEILESSHEKREKV